MDAKMGQMEERIDTKMSRMEERIYRKMEETIDDRIGQSEELLLDEMERYDKKNQKEFAEVKQRLDNLEGIYRMTKNEAETITMSLQLIKNLDVRVSKLEARAM